LRRYVLQTPGLVFFGCFAIWSTTAPLKRQQIDSEPTVVSHDIANTGADIASVVSVARPRHGSGLRLFFFFLVGGPNFAVKVPTAGTGRPKPNSE